MCIESGGSFSFVPLLYTVPLCLLCSVQVVGGSVDATVRQFDIRMGMMFTDTIHESVTGIGISHDGNCVLASCLDHSMKLLDKASGQLLATYTGETVPLIGATLLMCGSLFYPLGAVQK